jgi:ComF family protein
LYCRKNLEDRKAFCQSCSAQILPIVPFDFYVGNKKIIKVFAVSAYKNPIRSLLLAKHHGNETTIRFLADFIVAHPIVEFFDADIITFIPLHWTRYAARGFNQAEIIAKNLAFKTGRPVLPLVFRTKKTYFQARLSLSERENNVNNAFVINEKYKHVITGKKILIVDDLFTTGSTMRAVSSIILPYNPEKIEVFVACRVVSS